MTKKRHKFQRAGPGRPKSGSPPRNKRPAMSSHTLREEICRLMGIERHDKGQNQGFSKDELVLIYNYALLTCDLLENNQQQDLFDL